MFYLILYQEKYFLKDKMHKQTFGAYTQGYILPSLAD